MLSKCELKDLRLSESPFTWCNNRDGDNRVFEMFVRFLANSHWCSLFSNGCVSHKCTTYFDHCPILIDIGRTKMI